MTSDFSVIWLQICQISIWLYSKYIQIYIYIYIHLYTYYSPLKKSWIFSVQCFIPATNQPNPINPINPTNPTQPNHPIETPPAWWDHAPTSALYCSLRSVHEGEGSRRVKFRRLLRRCWKPRWRRCGEVENPWVGGNRWVRWSLGFWMVIFGMVISKLGQESSYELSMVYRMPMYTHLSLTKTPRK